MPRKASKTDHVLDLLAGKTEEVPKKRGRSKKVQVIEDTANSEEAQDISRLIENNLIRETKKASKEKAASKNSKKSGSKATGTTIKESTFGIKDADSIQANVVPIAPNGKFVYVNIMEAVVKSAIEKATKQFDMCTCAHCMADVMALTLTNLPAKYVVTDQQVSPLLNFYSSRYNEIVNIELMKSCTLVKKFPHH